MVIGRTTCLSYFSRPAGFVKGSLARTLELEAFYWCEDVAA